MKVTSVLLALSVVVAMAHADTLTPITKPAVPNIGTPMGVTNGAVPMDLGDKVITAKRQLPNTGAILGAAKDVADNKAKDALTNAPVKLPIATKRQLPNSGAILGAAKDVADNKAKDALTNAPVKLPIATKRQVPNIPAPLDTANGALADAAAAVINVLHLSVGDVAELVDGIAEDAIIPDVVAFAKANIEIDGTIAVNAKVEAAILAKIENLASIYVSADLKVALAGVIELCIINHEIDVKKVKVEILKLLTARFTALYAEVSVTLLAEISVGGDLHLDINSLVHETLDRINVDSITKDLINVN